jgi:hypothetical protein
MMSSDASGTILRSKLASDYTLGNPWTLPVVVDLEQRCTAATIGPLLGPSPSIEPSYSEQELKGLPMSYVKLTNRTVGCDCEGKKMINAKAISFQGTRAKRFWGRLQTAVAGKSSEKPPTIWLPRRVSSKPARYLSVVATIKNEGRYLHEWIEFQRLMGVEQVYLYDNGSTDNTSKVVATYAAEGFVSLIPWMNFDVDANVQFQCYAHALCNFGPLFRWMALIDLDEFLFPITARNLVEVLSRYEDCPALRVPRFSFGFSGHEIPPAGLIIENYTARAAYPPVPARKKLIGYKSIVRPMDVIGVDSAHGFHLNCGIKGGFDERGVLRTRKTRRHNPSPGSVLRINHYFTRSRQEFAEKINIRGDFGRSRASKKSRMANMIEHETVQDHAIMRFAPALHERISHRCSPSLGAVPPSLTAPTAVTGRPRPPRYAAEREPGISAPF